MDASFRGVLLAAAAALLAGCAPAPAPADQPRADPTADAGYQRSVDELAAFNRQAEALFQNGKYDEAAAIVTKVQPLQSRLLAAPRPTLAAMEAASDLDDLYGRMLLRNKQYGWARTFFQNNAVRWRTWKPQTPEVVERSKKAAAALAECERRLSE
jgi:hypothetical protein